MKRLALAVVLLAAALAPAQDFRPSGPSIDGTRATVDLPPSQHMRNIGGSDGAGLCVFTSGEVAESRWQSGSLDGFQRWMSRRPGGGWPEKLEEMIVKFCREMGRDIPPFTQHTGGDEDFLILALKTGRMPCVTYAGRDDFYRGPIAHMVNLAHLDDERACIIDNNRPGVWVWMSRKDFLSRWRDQGGGWAVVFLSSPPPPHPTAARQAFGQCPGGRCPTGPASLPPSDGEYLWYNGQWAKVVQPTPPAAPAPVAEPVKPAAAEQPKPEHNGVDTSKIHAGKRWFVNGAEVTKGEAMDALKLSDDSDRWHLVCVGSADQVGKFKQAVTAMDATTRGKLHVSTYTPDHWAVGLFELPAGVSMRKPAVGRVGAEAGRFAGELLPDTLGRFVSDTMNPKPPPAPMPPPAPTPTPEPMPTPAPEPTPPTTPNLNTWIMIALGAFVALILGNRRK